jgi:hypothetical protein
MLVSVRVRVGVGEPVSAAVSVKVGTGVDVPVLASVIEAEADAVAPVGEGCPVPTVEGTGVTDGMGTTKIAVTVSTLCVSERVPVTFSRII